MEVRRGRRPAGSGTREAIHAAAKRQFAELGYPGTTLRGIAREAGVDTRLVTHYFGSKQDLFVEVVELPMDLEALLAGLGEHDPAQLAHQLAQFVVATLELPSVRQTMVGLLRAAASEEEAALRVRDMLHDQLLLALTSIIGADQAELRASLIGSQVVGLAFSRHILGVPWLQDADHDVLVAALTPTFDNYLNSPEFGGA